MAPLTLYAWLVLPALASAACVARPLRVSRGITSPMVRGMAAREHVTRSSSPFSRLGLDKFRTPRRRRETRAFGMFDNLSDSITNAFSMIGKEEKLTPENIKKPLKQIRRALLEADVSLPVVRRFIANVENKVLTMDVQVSKALNPEQQLVKVVFEELTNLMGAERADLTESLTGPRIVLMAGLQGVGKTTQTGKLALLLKKQKQRVLLASLDVYRPAAMNQLQTLAKRIDVDIMPADPNGEPVKLALDAAKRAQDEGYDCLILDTAGRLQIDEDMIGELKDVKDKVRPTDTLLVVDSMTGQEAAKVVKAFSDAVDLTGAILTKLDGDSRGGAALSVNEVAGKPIKFVGVGEQMDDLDPFYPDRMAQRILGMGDMLTLIEKAESAISDKDAKSFEEKMRDGTFDFNDFKKQFDVVKKMGPLNQISKMIPGMKASDQELTEGEKRVKKFMSLIESMNKKERADPSLFDKGRPGAMKRRMRIAKGAGRTLDEVDELMMTMRAMRRQIGSMMGLRQDPVRFVIPKGSIMYPRFTEDDFASFESKQDYFNIAELTKMGINMTVAPWYLEPEKYPNHAANRRSYG